MISIITGTLNRGPLLPRLIENTVEANEKLELVLVDGGSTDGTIEYIKEETHPRIKLIELGGRSPYPHFMNVAIQNATHEIVCQWNDDVLLSNDWDEVISEIDEDHDFYLFNWKYGSVEDITDPNWLYGHNHQVGSWCLLNNIETPVDGNNEIVMNYGLYKKNIFRNIGMYNNEYRYYYADADMANRAYRFGYRVKDLRNIKVCSLFVDKVANYYYDDVDIYNKNRKLYENKILPDNLEFLK
jgi:glycosyltransferase involved in cell wall biosynthesis